MKFKYIGQDNRFSPELIIYGIKKPNEKFKTGEIIDVPDDLENIITSLKLTGLFIPVDEKVSKKEKK